MHVTVVAYDPQWPGLFAKAAAELEGCLGKQLVEIHHIGSTSIPRIHAKPVIDMLAAVPDFQWLDGHPGDIESIGYEVMGEFGIPGRRYFRRNNSAGERTQQIHAFEVGSPHIQRHLAFRDFMRVHSVDAEQYSMLKQRLAEAYPDDINAYMAGKDQFIKEMERRAILWSGRSSS